jgi:2-polyprenyl-6-methoxyphenol hydroxylase-like FAD-dependent oxidoreductase
VGSTRKKVLISGAGVAGPTLAWWLDHYGFEPSIVEIAPEFRTGGYMVDFWGKGYDIVERMGLLPQVLERGYHIKEVRFVHSDGSRAAGFSTDPFWRGTGGRFTIPRTELAEVIWDALPAGMETRFGDEIAAIDQGRDGVHVTFAKGGEEQFDFIVGADGLHSRVRELIFGPEEKFETFLGYAFAAFTVSSYEPRTTDTYVSYGIPGQQVSRVSMRGDRTLILFIWRDKEFAVPHTPEDRRAMLRNRFAGIGWESDRMIEALDRSDDLYVDRMSQIHLPHWSLGRVALVGDSAWAPSFLAGEGTGLGIIGAYVLAGELHRSGELSAFQAYERKLRDLIEPKQEMASKFGSAFAPKSKFGLHFRNWVANLLDVPVVASLALSGVLKDKIDLPEYEADGA